MGGPAVGHRMHRSARLRSSGPSAGLRRRAAARASARCCASGVSDGTRPSGGSTTSDVRLVPTTFVPRSYQNWLYARPRSASVPPARLSASRAVSVCFSNSAASCSVRTGLSPMVAGRSNGVMVALVHRPCKSGSPHGVRSTRGPCRGLTNDRRDGQRHTGDGHRDVCKPVPHQWISGEDRPFKSACQLIRQGLDFAWEGPIT